MALGLIIFFLVSTTVLLVESGCSYYNVFRIDFDALCEKWWLKSDLYSTMGSSRRNCIQLIKAKCPKMLKFKTSITKSYDRDRFYYETWKETVEATRRENENSWRTYYVFTRHPLCWDNNGRSVSCDFWWEIAQEATAENEYKEFCINQITKHCPKMISKLSEKDLCEVQRCRKGFDVKTVTYNDKKGNKASFNRYIPVKKSDSKPPKN